MGNPYIAMAQLLAEKLSDEELVQLDSLMDGDGSDQLPSEVAKIVEQRYPELFADEADVGTMRCYDQYAIIATEADGEGVGDMDLADVDPCPCGGDDPLCKCRTGQ